AAELLCSVRPPLAAHLAAIEYAEACTIGFAYNRSQVGHSLDGFGFMVPRQEGFSTICTFWNSSLFPQRAAGGKVLISSCGRSGAISDSETQMLMRRTEEENARVLGIKGAPLDRMFWSDQLGLPQYVVGHARRVTEIYNELGAVPNLHLVGNYL